MRRHILSRLTAAGLSLALLLLPAAQALTPEQAAQLLQIYYIDEVPQSVLERPTIPEMLEALGDPYTEYFTAEEFAAFTSSMQDSTMVGIGIFYSLTADGLFLSDVMAGSPAEKGGLQAGDLIVAVDGRDILKAADVDVISGWFQGEAGTKVRITYLRDGDRRTVTLTLDTVTVPATSSYLLDGHIGFIDCDTFGDETFDHFRKAIDKYGDRADVWIVDLRSNLGGITNAAVDSAGLFTGPGDILYFRDGAGNYERYSYGAEAATEAPVITLVDQHTASAAELFAAAIRSYSRGIVIGERTYGKGIAQSVLTQHAFPSLFADGDAFKITSHRFFSPTGNTTDHIGVIPDLPMDGGLSYYAALTLAGSRPQEDGLTLRLNLCGYYWDIDLNTAVQDDPEVLLALLEAASSSRMWLGSEGSGWTPVTAAQAAEQAGLDYAPPLFTDHSRSQYPEALSALRTHRLVRGVGDGSYRPEQTLTRAELCQMLSVVLKRSASNGPSPYADVSDDAWYAPAVLAVSGLGLAEGDGRGLFLPEEPVDHQQLITIMGRLAQMLNMFLYEQGISMPEEALQSGALSGYAAWAKPSVWLLAESQTGYFGNVLNLLWDDPADIDPTAPATRDEAAYLLWRLLVHLDILPSA